MSLSVFLCLYIYRDRVVSSSSEVVIYWSSEPSFTHLILRDLGLTLVIQDQHVWLEPSEAVRTLSDLGLPVGNELATHNIEAVPTIIGMLEIGDS